jgi:hypothetical protein
MKQAQLFLSVFVFMLFTCCEKGVEPKPESNTLVQDLQNGYWETHFTSGAIMVLQFDISTSTSYWIEGTPPCILDIATQAYMLDGNLLTLGDDKSEGIVEIQGDTLIITWESDGFDATFERKSILEYTEC